MEKNTARITIERQTGYYLAEHQEERLRQYEPVFGGWTIEEEIGSGSFSHIYRIQNEAKAEAVVKVITISYADSMYQTPEAFGDYYKQVYSEVKKLAELKGYRSIVAYEDSAVKRITDESGRFLGFDILIKMEKLESLDQYLREGEILSEEQTVELGIDICRALEVVMRETKLVHRDIKPQNIFVTRDGGFKLGDFGVAGSISEAADLHTMVGTPPYMAPEVRLCDTYNQTADIYSLGLVMYELLNGNHLPFYEAGKDSMAELQENLRRRMAGESLPDLPVSPQLNEIIKKACAVSPAERYQTPEEMAEALTAYQMGRKSGKPVQHGERWYFVLMTVIAVVLLLGYILWSVGEEENAVGTEALQETAVNEGKSTGRKKKTTTKPSAESKKTTDLLVTTPLWVPTYPNPSSKPQETTKEERESSEGAESESKTEPESVTEAETSSEDFNTSDSETSDSPAGSDVPASENAEESSS